MTTNTKTPPAQVKVAELNKVAAVKTVEVCGKSFGLYIGDKEVARYDALAAKHPKVVDALKSVVVTVEGVTDAYRTAVRVIHSEDMTHEDSSFLMRAWGWGRDRISMVHRIVDASPTVRDAYLKGDFGFRRALTEARTESELGDNGPAERGGKRGGKPGGTKAQRDQLALMAATIGRELKGWLKSAKPVKSGPQRAGDWVVSVVAVYRPEKKSDET